jgi:hypothetical protein
MAALDPSRPVSPRNPDYRYDLFAHPSGEHLGTFHTEADARACMSTHRPRYSAFRMQEVRWHRPFDETAPLRRIPVLGVVS